MKKAIPISFGCVAFSLGLILFGGGSSVGAKALAPEVEQSVVEPSSMPVDRPTMAVAAATAAADEVYQAGDVYLKNSRVYVFVGKTGFGHEHAIEGALSSGKLLMSGGDAPGELVFDMRSFNSDTTTARKYVGLQGGIDARTRGEVNANMLGPQVLDVRTFPTAKLTVTSIVELKEKSGDGLPQFRIDGKFTLHGTTQNISFFATSQTNGDWFHVRGRFSILQSDYGIRPFKKAFGAVGVTDELTIWGDLSVAGKRVVISKVQ